VSKRCNSLNNGKSGTVITIGGNILVAIKEKAVKFITLNWNLENAYAAKVEIVKMMMVETAVMVALFCSA